MPLISRKMLFKNSAISSWFFNRVEKEFSFTSFFAVSQKKNTVQLEVGTQSNYTTELQPSPPRRVYQPLYFGKIPGNIISSYFFIFFSFPKQRSHPFMYSCIISFESLAIINVL